MQFDWNLLKPNRKLSDAQASLAREIADIALKTGIGIPDHQKRVQLQKDRHQLDDLCQFGLIRNVANRFYPTFPGLYLVDSPLRDTYATALDLMFRAIKAIFEDKSYQNFRIQELEQQFARVLSGIGSEDLKKTVSTDAPPHKAALFLQDFPNFVYIQESQYPNSPVLSLSCKDNMFDYESLEQAWKYELAQRPRPPAPQPPPQQPKALAEPESSTEKRKKVFVIYGRDTRLRDGVFTFLRALYLEPLEWINAIQLTGKASPYIGEILEAAFSHAQAVVVLLSPDDEAKLRMDLLHADDPSHERELTGQARPNVLFEAGMAFGSHGDGTVLVQFGQVRPFSDIAGRHIVKMDNSGVKRQEFASKLKLAGCAVNLDGTHWHTAGDLTPPIQNVAVRSDKGKVSNVVSLRPLNEPRRVAPDENDTWREVGYGEKHVLAALAIFRNQPGKGVSPHYVHDLTAQIAFFEAGGSEVQRVYHGIWLGDPLNRIDLAVGDTREMLIAIYQAAASSPFAIENTRRYTSDDECEGSRMKPLERKHYDVTVRLIGRATTSGDITTSFIST